ncbi:MAG TPA: hypothetical protein VML55_26175, partial [Planctomycetaceae bacterium]|nr:hypothetical protein [Planctomycetaceae bacterium]
VGLAKSLGVDECLLAMQEFRQRFLADPALDLAAIDFHTSNGEFDKALEAIDRLDAAIGGDPALNVIRASLKIGQKDLDAARALLNEAISREAAVEHALWELAVVSVAEEKFGEAVERLSDIERRFGIRRPNFIEAPEFAALAGTAEYEQWQQSRGQAAPSPDAASP